MVWMCPLKHLPPFVCVCVCASIWHAVSCRGVGCSHKEAEKVTEKVCEADRSAVSFPYWPSTASNNAMKHWDEVEASQTPSFLLPAILCPFSSRCFKKYPTNYLFLCIKSVTDTSSNQETWVPKTTVKAFSFWYLGKLPGLALMENNGFFHFATGFVQRFKINELRD